MDYHNSNPLEIPKNKMLGMTRSRGLVDYLYWLFFATEHDKPRHTLASKIQLLQWLLNFPSELAVDPNDFWEDFARPLQAWIKSSNIHEKRIVDLGCGAGNFILELNDYLGWFWPPYGKPRLIGVEKYDLSNYYGNSWKKIRKSSNTEIRFGDFTELPIESSSISRAVSVYGFLFYGSEEYEDFGISQQVKELRRIAANDFVARITLIPEKLHEEDHIDRLFYVKDPITNSVLKLPILRLLNEVGFKYKMIHIIDHTSDDQYPPVYEISLSEES